jgi:uncharacterized membrane protein YfcA
MADDRTLLRPGRGYAGAWLQPHLPETLLRLLLGAVAAGLAALYVLQVVGLLGP